MSLLVFKGQGNDLMPLCLLFPKRFVIGLSACDLLQQETSVDLREACPVFRL